MIMDGSYWDSPAGWMRLAQGADPMNDSELRFYSETDERIAAARAFREAHGASTYDPLSASQEQALQRSADQELRRATARGLDGTTTLAEGEEQKIMHRMRLLHLSKQATDGALVTRGQLSPDEVTAWRRSAEERERIAAGPARGVPR